jgi:hypothetical protein
MEIGTKQSCTPRHQPITNFQIQQQQAKLMKNKAMATNQKMNKTAFGTSLPFERKSS